MILGTTGWWVCTAAVGLGALLLAWDAFAFLFVASYSGVDPAPTAAERAWLILRGAVFGLAALFAVLSPLAARWLDAARAGG